jgi:hypothetical protein
MHTNRTSTILARLALGVGAAALLATAADHLDEYTANHFSTVPTIGTLFLLNFIVATAVAVGLVLPWKRITKRYADRVRAFLALSGIGIAASSLIGLWISESSSLFGFTDHGSRPTIVVAIVAESLVITALTAYLTLEHLGRRHPVTHLPGPETATAPAPAGDRAAFASRD